MRQSELYKLLRSTGLEVYFYEADQGPALPYIVYLKDGEAAWGSDGRNFLRKDSYIVELYSARKDFANQEKLRRRWILLGFVTMQRKSTSRRKKCIW